MNLVDNIGIESEIIEILGNVSKIGYWIYHVPNEELFWSEATKKIHEVPKDYRPHLKTAIQFYKEGESREIIDKAVKEAIETGQAYDVKLQIVTYNGNEKWVRAIGRIEKEGEKVTRMYGTFQDIDEYIKQKEQLQTLNKRLKVAADVADLGIWEWEIEEDNLYWDKKLYEIYGIDENDFSGHYEAWESSLDPVDKEKSVKALMMALEEKEPLDIEFSVIKKNGVKARIWAKGRLVKDELGKPFKMVGVNRDITARTIMNDQLRKLYESNEEQNKYLTNFAHTMTHNLRSSSNNLSMLLDMIKKESDPKQRESFLEMMEKSCNRLNDTISGLNQTISIRYAENKEFSQVNVLSTINKALENINELVRSNNVELSINVHKSLKIRGIDTYFESIFQNFITNSIKYRQDDIAPIIRIDSREIDNKVFIIFSDNGKGIDLKRHGKNLFGMYKTFHGNKDAKGIGLYLTKSQIETMGGTIEVESEPNSGTTFTLTFKK